jgi:sugar lactone lactonase YvrE
MNTAFAAPAHTARVAHSAWRVLGDIRAEGLRDRVGESPVWDAASACLYWVDIEGRLLRRHHLASGRTVSWQLPERPGCIALSTRGTVIAAMETGIFELSLHEAEPANGSNSDLAAQPVRTLTSADIRLLAAIEHPQAGMRFNDGRCDPDGRLWVGTMVMDMSLAATVGGLYCLDSTGLRGPLVQGLITPNGLAFSPDGHSAWQSDSHPSVQTIWRFQRNPATGELSGRKPWVQMRDLPGRPDGAALDAEGCYWICGNDAGLIHRFSPAGELLQSVPVPFPKPAMCCFGGPELRTLFVTSIQPSASAGPVGDSGLLMACELSVAGVPEPLFSQFPPPKVSANIKTQPFIQPVTQGDKP